MSIDGNARRGVVSVGVAGALGPEAIARIAAAVEQAGFHALWVNDTPHGDSIAALSAAAAATERLTLATGVIPLDRRPPGEVAEAIRAAGLPESKGSQETIVTLALTPDQHHLVVQAPAGPLPPALPTAPTSITPGSSPLIRRGPPRCAC